MNVIFPVFVLSMLNVMCFAIEPESGEKLGLCISTFLTFVVFLTVVVNSMPSASLTISFLQIYLNLQVLLNAVSISLNIYVIRVYHRDPKIPVSVNLQRISKWILERPAYERGQNVNVAEGKCPYNDLAPNTANEQQDQAETFVYNMAWVNVAKSLDIIFFWLFLCLSIGISAAFLTVLNF